MRTRDLRGIGALGRVARVAVGAAMAGSVVEGHISGDFHPGPWGLGLVGFPAGVLVWHRWMASRHPGRLQATGLTGHLAGTAVFFALYLTWWYAPALEVTSDAVLLFYGCSMLLAAARGRAGCEVLAFSNWMLRRDDEAGCLLFEPVDRLAPRRLPEPALEDH